MLMNISSSNWALGSFIAPWREADEYNHAMQHFIQAVVVNPFHAVLCLSATALERPALLLLYMYYVHRGGRYHDEKLSKADKSAFLKLSAIYRYRKMEILELSKNYRYRKKHQILANK